MKSILSNPYSFSPSSFLPSLSWPAYALSAGLALVPGSHFQKAFNHLGLTHFEMTSSEGKISSPQKSLRLKGLTHIRELYFSEESEGHPAIAPSKIQSFIGNHQHFEQKLLRVEENLILPLKHKIPHAVTHPLHPDFLMREEGKHGEERTPTNTSLLASEDACLSPLKEERNSFDAHAPQIPSPMEADTAQAIPYPPEPIVRTENPSVGAKELDAKDTQDSEIFCEALPCPLPEMSENVESSETLSPSRSETSIQAPLNIERVEVVRAIDHPPEPKVQEFRELPRLWHQYPELGMGNARFILSRVASRHQVTSQEYPYITALIDAVLEFQGFINSLDWNEEDYQEIRREFVLWYLLKIDWRETEYGLHKDAMLGDPCKLTSFLEENFARDAFLEKDLRDDVQEPLFDLLRAHALINDEEAFLGSQVQAPRPLEELGGRLREILETRIQKRLDLIDSLRAPSPEMIEMRALPLVKGALSDQGTGEDPHF